VLVPGDAGSFGGKVPPATLSHKSLTGVLREKLQFGGLIISDSMAMAAVADNYGRKDAWIRAVLAGVDMILDTSSDDIEQHYRAFVDAAQTSPQLRARVEAACLNIVAHKVQYGIVPAPGFVPPTPPAPFQLREAEAAATQLARGAIAVREGTVRKFQAVVAGVKDLPLHILYNPAIRDLDKFVAEMRLTPGQRPMPLTPGGADSCTAFRTVGRLTTGVVVILLRHFEGTSVGPMPTNPHPNPREGSAWIPSRTRRASSWRGSCRLGSKNTPGSTSSWFPS
jgi:hypothetical protein